jgi:carbonic anhydrase
MLSLRSILVLILWFTTSLGFAAEKDMPYKMYERNNLSPHQVLEKLQNGNKRYIQKKMIHRNFQEEMREAKAGQQPIAIVLSCMDSRNIPYLSFDQGIGDLFSLRVAGNVLSDDMLGSIEFGTKVVGTPLIVVMGHNHCGAVVGACKQVELGHLTGLLGKIEPAVKMMKQKYPKANCKDEPFVDAVAKQNVINMLGEIPKRSPIVAQLLRDKKVAIVGAMYDIGSGKITFFDEKGQGL